jgi:2-C-methyl-D-erythritol 4-phosphate cytidylyltransferase
MVTGGSSRQESVRLGVAAVPPEVDTIVCHDAARPFAAPELFSAVIAALKEGDVEGAVPVVPVPDTVKRVQVGRVVETVQRDELALAQTPQAFAAAALRSAHERAAAEGFSGTDDAVLLERAGYSVRAVPGDPANFKVTTAEDLARAEALLSEGQPARARRG